MKKYLGYIGALLLAGTLLWANSPGNSSLIEQQPRLADEQISELKETFSSSRERCEALERENRELKEKIANLEANLASVEIALDLPVRDSDEPVDRLQNICSYIKDYYTPFRSKRLKLLSEEDWSRINFSLEKREETRERIRDYERFVKEYSGKRIIILPEEDEREAPRRSS